MVEKKDIILVSEEARQAVRAANEISCPDRREQELRALGIDAIRLEPEGKIEDCPMPLGTGEAVTIFESSSKSPHQRAQDWLDAICVVCLPVWMKQLRALGIHDAGLWQQIAREREGKRQNAKRNLR